MINKSRIALITGVNGQDGSYLARFLLTKGYEVWGTSRDADGSSLNNLKILGIKNQIKMISMTPEDFRSVLATVDTCKPDEIYNLAGQSSVGLSFELPSETIQGIITGSLNMLEACRMCKRRMRLYHAGSSECYGDTGGSLADESTPFNPRSPYGVAKASAHWLVNNYREAYNLHACSGIMFNHESPLRPSRFVTQKIITTAKRIAMGSSEKLELGRTDISRDWGWAPEYVVAMWKILQLENPDDFVISTGNAITLEEFTEITFSILGLNWRDHVIQSANHIRPTDILLSQGNPEKAQMILGWKAAVGIQKVIHNLINEIHD